MRGLSHIETAPGLRYFLRCASVMMMPISSSTPTVISTVSAFTSSLNTKKDNASNNSVKQKQTICNAR